MENTDKTYFVAIDDQVFGPYSISEILNLGILPDTLVSRYDSEWLKASDMPEFSHLFRQSSNRQTTAGVVRRPLYDNKKLIYKQKRKAALIGVLSLGLAGLSIIGIGETWKSNIFAGTSLDHGGFGFVLKIISFMLLSVVIAIPFFIISVFRLIYYSFKLS